MLAVFAIELSNTQAKSKADVEARVHERAVLAAALVDSLFQTMAQQIPQDESKFGTRVVTARTMDACRQQDTYLALLDSAGRVLASSTDSHRRRAAIWLARPHWPWSTPGTHTDLGTSCRTAGPV